MSAELDEHRMKLNNPTLETQNSLGCALILGQADPNGQHRRSLAG